MVRVVREEAQQDRLARMEPHAIRGLDADGLVQHLGRPAIETAIDDRPRAREGLGEFVRPARMVEILLPARLGGVGPGGRLDPRLPDHVAEPEDANAGHVADRGPDRPPLGSGPDAELVIAHPADEVDDVAVIHRPVGIERADRGRAHALKGNRLRRRCPKQHARAGGSSTLRRCAEVGRRKCEAGPQGATARTSARASVVGLGGLRLLARAEDARDLAAVARGLGAPAADRAAAVVHVAVRDHDVERVDRRLLVRVAAGDPAAGSGPLLLRLDDVVVLAVGDVPELDRAADVDRRPPCRPRGRGRS